MTLTYNKTSPITPKTILSILFIFSLLLISIEPTLAAPGGDPGLLGKAKTDTSQIDKGALALIQWAIYIGFTLGLAGIAVGITMSSPLLAMKRKGMEILRHSIYVCAGSAFFWLLIGIGKEIAGK